jgi:hypothetical protein
MYVLASNGNPVPIWAEGHIPYRKRCPDQDLFEFAIL